MAIPEHPLKEGAHMKTFRVIIIDQQTKAILSGDGQVDAETEAIMQGTGTVSINKPEDIQIRGFRTYSMDWGNPEGSDK
jgi:hypothetical protein